MSIVTPGVSVTYTFLSDIYNDTSVLLPLSRLICCNNFLLSRWLNLLLFLFLHLHIACTSSSSIWLLIVLSESRVHLLLDRLLTHEGYSFLFADLDSMCDLLVFSHVCWSCISLVVLLVLSASCSCLIVLRNLKL